MDKNPTFEIWSKILIIDDMETMRRIVHRNLKSLGYTNTLEAEDGEKAWALIESEDLPFHVIISDWNMPNCSGLDLLKKVRADKRFEKTPFILLTAESEVTQVQEAIQAGVDNYIVKPFSGDALEKKLLATYQRTLPRVNPEKAKAAAAKKAA